ncbi:MAG: sulfatase [Planctomycetota bacterium]
MTRLVLLVAGALVLAGCGARALPDGSLLGRAPDVVVEERGSVEPAQGDAWGDGGEGEWFARLARVDDGPPMCWSKGRRAYLLLHSLGDGPHRLRLHVAGAPGGAESLAVKLGERDLGEVEVDARARWVEFETEASDWVAGDNLLTLDVDATGQLVDDRFAGIGVARVEWAPPRRVEHERGALVLASGTSVVYHLAPGAGAKLAVAGRTDGDGSLIVSTGTFEPRDSTSTFGGELRTVLPERGAVDLDVALDALDSVFSTGTGSLRLEWHGDAPFEVDDLRVVAGAAPPPNVVFVSVDTLAAKHLSCYGYPRDTTPAIDAFARESVLFESCTANASWTVPSYLSQLSGLFPRAHEIDPVPGIDAQAWDMHHLASSRWTLAEALRSRGYATAAWLDNPWVSAGLGMDQGFDLFDTSAAKIYLKDTDGGFAHMLEPSMRWMRARTEPFFAMLQPMDPHGPYFTKWRYRGRWDGDGTYDVEHDAPVGFGQLHVYGVVPEYVAWEERRGYGGPLERMRTEPFANAYDEKIAEVDDYFARLVGFLDRSGLLDSSIVVLSADHGEAVGEHDYYFDHGTLYDEVARVPLIVHLPGGRRGGTRVSTPVQLVDLMPTLLELAGAPVPEHLHGRSLVPALEGRAIEQVPIWCRGGIGTQDAIVVGDHKLVWSIPTQTSPQTKIRHPKLPEGRLEEVAPELATTWKSNAEIVDWFRQHPQKEKDLFAPIQGEFRELYDLRTDPLELDDLNRGEPSTEARRLVDELEAVRLEQMARGDAAREGASRAVRPAVVSDAVREQLEALGYLEKSRASHE